MPRWSSPKRGGWGQSCEAVHISFTQVLRTILEVVPGGVIRAGKASYADDRAVGFWLGIDTDGAAKLNIGGAANYLKWTGRQLLVYGSLRAGAGEVMVDISDGVKIVEGIGQANCVSWVNAAAAVKAHVYCVRDAGSQVRTLYVRVEPEPGEDAQVALQAYAPPETSDLVELYLVSQQTTPGPRSFAALVGGDQFAGLRIGKLADGTVPAAMLDVGGDGVFSGRVGVAAATTGGDALNRDTADGRYVQARMGWSGTLASGDGRTLTVVHGQITGVA
jgi:hypothetical protein